MKIFIYSVLIVFGFLNFTNFARSFNKKSFNDKILKKDLPSLKNNSGNWQPLFNGKNLDGWIVFLGYRSKEKILHLNKNSQKVFKVENGEIHFYKEYDENSIVPEGFLATEKEYSNFHLKFDFKWGNKKFAQRINKKRNSGVMFLAQDTIGFWPTSVECQIMEGDVGDIYAQNDAWITTTVDSFILDPSTKNKIPVYSPRGKLYNHGGEGSRRLAHDAQHDKSEGWNTVEIIVKDNKARYVVNGKENARLRDIRYVNPENPNEINPLLKGRILLQAEATEIFFVIF
jgi:3-keto-disaccharide hydrolase